MKFMRTATIAAALLGLSLGTSFAVDPLGTWFTEEGKATVRIAPCGPALCGTIISLKEPNDPATGKPKTDQNNVEAGLRGRPVVGVLVVLGMKPSGTANKWSARPIREASPCRMQTRSRSRAAFWAASFARPQPGPGPADGAPRRPWGRLEARIHKQPRREPGERTQATLLWFRDAGDCPKIPAVRALRGKAVPARPSSSGIEHLRQAEGVGEIPEA